MVHCTKGDTRGKELENESHRIGVFFNSFISRHTSRWMQVAFIYRQALVGGYWSSVLGRSQHEKRRNALSSSE